MAVEQNKLLQLNKQCSKAKATAATLYKKCKLMEVSHKEQKINNLKKIRSDQLENILDDNGKEVILGAGIFGTCKFMKFKVGTDTLGVAVKEYRNETCKENAIREALLLQQLNHQCFPFFLGCILESAPILVLELCSYDSNSPVVMTIFDAMLSKNKSLTFFRDENVWLLILEKCCRGFTYMHEVHGVLHNDIKADNIVLLKRGEEILPKIIDFNKSLHINECKRKHLTGEEQKKYKVFHKHVAPEVYTGLSPQSKSSDVYSFGFMVGKIASKFSFKVLLKISEMCILNNPKYRVTFPELCENFTSAEKQRL